MRETEDMVQTELKRTALSVRIWRRGHPAEPMADMPVELQHNVVRLLEGHSWDEVCEAVGIGKSSLSILRKRHCEVSVRTTALQTSRAVHAHLAARDARRNPPRNLDQASRPVV